MVFTQKNSTNIVYVGHGSVGHCLLEKIFRITFGQIEWGLVNRSKAKQQLLIGIRVCDK